MSVRKSLASGAVILGHAVLGALAGTQRSSVATSGAQSSDHWNRLNSANRCPSAILEDMFAGPNGCRYLSGRYQEADRRTAP